MESCRELQLPGGHFQLCVQRVLARIAGMGQNKMVWYNTDVDLISQYGNKKDSLSASDRASSFMLWICCHPPWFVQQLEEKNSLQVFLLGYDHSPILILSKWMQRVEHSDVSVLLNFPMRLLFSVVSQLPRYVFNVLDHILQAVC